LTVTVDDLHSWYGTMWTACYTDQYTSIHACLSF